MELPIDVPICLPMISPTCEVNPAIAPVPAELAVPPPVAGGDLVTAEEDVDDSPDEREEKEGMSEVKEERDGSVGIREERLGSWPRVLLPERLPAKNLGCAPMARIFEFYKASNQTSLLHIVELIVQRTACGSG